jgi:hypothetical protein
MSALCNVLEVSSVMEEEVVEGDELHNNLGMDDMAQIGSGRWPRGHCIHLGMDDMA